MQLEGATKIELDLLEVLRWNEGSGCSVEHTARSVAISNAIEELQRLRSHNNRLMNACQKAFNFVDDEFNNKEIVKMDGSFGLHLDLKTAIEEIS